MPVHKPGPQLYSSIPFKHLANKHGGGGGGGGVVNLNMTPFVDMMTILVCFLLMVFSAQGQLLSSPKGLKLPDATVEKDLRKAPIIVVTRGEIALDGEEMAKVKEIQEDESLEWKIVALHDRLQAMMRQFREKRAQGKLSEMEEKFCKDPDPADPKKMCLEGLIIMQADRSTTAKVLNRILKTAYAAEYTNIMFAVNRRKTRAE